MWRNEYGFSGWELYHLRIYPQKDDSIFQSTNFDELINEIIFTDVYEKKNDGVVVWCSGVQQEGSGEEWWVVGTVEVTRHMSVAGDFSPSSLADNITGNLKARKKL
jgi:hypothetical protein